MKHTGRASVVARACLGATLVLLLVLHALRSDLDPWIRHLSEYAIGAHGALMTLAFLISAGGAAAVAAMFATTVAESPSRRVARAGLALAAVTNAAMAIFVTDLSVPDATGLLARTTSGKIHDWLARAHALAWLIATAATALALRVDPRWRRFVPWSIATGTLVILGLTGRILSTPTAVGITQRIWVATILAWGLAHAIAAPPPRARLAASPPR